MSRLVFTHLLLLKAMNRRASLQFILLNILAEPSECIESMINAASITQNDATEHAQDSPPIVSGHIPVAVL